MDAHIDKTSDVGSVSVLVVDDSASCRLAVQECLLAEGVYVQVESRGEDAVRFLELMRPSAVITDHGMPGMSGLELLKWIRATPSLRNLPVIMITGGDDFEQRMEALRAGVDDFLTKPFDPLELQLRLRNLLRLQSYRREVEERNRNLKAEVAQRTAEVLKQAEVVENAADAIISTDPAFRVQTWNRGAESIYGLRAESAKGRLLFGLLRTEWVSRDEESMLADLEDKGRWVGELSQAAAAGRSVRVRASVTRLLDPDGALTGYAFVNHDLTEQTQARLLMAQAASRSREVLRLEALGSLTRGIAHDFNNWLAVIMSYTAVLLEDTASNDPRHQDLSVVLEASTSASSLVQQLLAYSRQQVLAPELADLNLIVQRVGQLLGRVLGEPIRLVLKLGEELPSICADVGQIEQVIMNLAVNARDAMPQGGVLTLSTETTDLGEDDAHLLALAPGRYVLLSVEDTGIGMDEDLRTRIFEPFFTTKGPDRGTGLGLSSVYGILRQSGGQIIVDSTLGKGSCFFAYVPTTSPDCEPARAKMEAMAEATQPTEGPQEERPKVGAKVWIVEDQAPIRNMVLRSLRRFELEVQTFSSAELALAQMQTGLPDLLITDVSMPGMSGPDLVDAARALDSKLPVLYVTGYWPGAHPEPSADNPTFLLQKPFTPESIRAMVQRALHDLPAG